MKSLARPMLRRLGPLDALDFAASESAPVILCLHGYGANAADLAPFAMEIDLPSPTRWIFPHAPLPVPDFEGGRAWFPIDEAAMMDAQVAGKTIDLSSLRPPGLDEAVKSVQGLIDAIEVPWERIIIGGFSQGAMTSLEAALRAPIRPLGLFLLSGTLVDEPELKKQGPKLAGLEFFNSHGRQDPILGFDQARKLNKTLNSVGLKGDLLEFDGGHGVPRAALDGLERYLTKVLPPREKA